ncbi:hypothetical protein RN001_015712 [Aquatica leii]|uniref:Uncharacterized protein n=1 Tax=Aquatica leii TaxID=1421715 RepID=A0AAN7SK14_9COLE|nr:hypothetical protein RN001_015712 [Aquatica leii]
MIQNMQYTYNFSPQERTKVQEKPHTTLFLSNKLFCKILKHNFCLNKKNIMLCKKKYPLFAIKTAYLP